MSGDEAELTEDEWAGIFAPVRSRRRGGGGQCRSSAVRMMDSTLSRSIFAVRDVRNIGKRLLSVI